MVDDKKIEAAVEEYNEKVKNELEKKHIQKRTFAERYAESAIRECAFKTGAKWAICEFLKDLWHPASEEPKKVKNLLLETTYEYGKPIYHLIKYMPNGNNVCAWREWYKGAHISRWLYIDDLLPKEGGE